MINLKSLRKDCCYALGEKYVFPVIDACWDTEQNNVINTLKDRRSQSHQPEVAVVILQATVISMELTQCWMLKLKRL